MTDEANNRGDQSLALWAAKKFRLFLIMELSDSSGGSTSCVIDEFSSDLLRLSWPSETENHRGELVVSLRGASRTIDTIGARKLVSGSNYFDPNEPFVCVTLPNGDKLWLVMMRPSEADDV
jgi:hypothetical protein